MIHISSGRDEPDTVLELSLDLVEMLLGVLRGQVPSSSESQGAAINLAIFTSRLARLPYQSLLLTDGDHLYTISTSDHKTLALAALSD